MWRRLLIVLCVLLPVDVSAQVFRNSNDPSLDTTAPTVTITAPTSSATYDAGVSATLTTIAGTSSDASGTAICRWTNSLGGSGTANTAADGVWSIPLIALTVGSNVITVSCLDPGNNTGTDVLTVTRSASGACEGLRCFYLQGDNTFNGDGTLATPAASNNAPGAFNSVTSAFAALTTPGDALLVRARAGAVPHLCTFGDDNTKTLGGCHIANSGTLANPIRVMSYLGEEGFLSNGPVTCTTHTDCDNATITADNEQYIIIGGAVGRGLKIIGSIWLWGNYGPSGDADRAAGLEASYNEIIRGYSEFGDGNHSGIRWQSVTGAWIHRNNIHDIALAQPGTAGSNGSSMVCVKLFHATNTIVEYNTCTDVSSNGGVLGGTNQAGGIDDKSHPLDNIHRYNKMVRVPVCVRGSNQVPPGRQRVYGNWCVSSTIPTGDACFKMPFVSSDATALYNNTCYGFGDGVYNGPGNTPGPFQIYNNIFANQTTTINFDISCGVLCQSGWTPVNYNIFTPGGIWGVAGSVYTSLTTYKAGAAHGQTWDQQSIERACTFVNAPTDLRLNDATCAAHGHVGGLSGGAVVAAGWEGVTSCVGHTCS